MFHEGTHIECCNNQDAPNLVIGSIYYVERVLKPNFLWRLIYRNAAEAWGVLLFNDPTPYHHSHFRAPTRPVKPESFNLKSSPFA